MNKIRSMKEQKKVEDGMLLARWKFKKTSNGLLRIVDEVRKYQAL